jgi:alpha-glucosidase
MLKPLVYDQSDIQIIETTDLFFKPNSSMSILEPNAMGRRMYVPRGQ